MTGSKEITFNTQRLQTFITDYYTVTHSVQPAIYEGSSYKMITLSSNEQCAAYCHLDNVQPCLAFSMVDTKCYLIDLKFTGTPTLSAENMISFNTGNIFFSN